MKRASVGVAGLGASLFRHLHRHLSLLAEKRSKREVATLVECGTGNLVEVQRASFVPVTSARVRLRPGDTFQGGVWDDQARCWFASDRPLSPGHVPMAIGRVTRGPVPASAVHFVRDLVARLGALGLYVEPSADALAADVWSSNDDISTHATRIRQVVHDRFISLPSAHPDLDQDYMAMVTSELRAALSQHVPGFDLRGVGDPCSDEEPRGHFIVDPGGREIPYGAYDYEAFEEVLDPVVEELNARLEAAGSPLRWLKMKFRHILLSPELAEFLISSELV